MNEDDDDKHSTRTVLVGKAVSLVTMWACFGFACWLYWLSSNDPSKFGSVYGTVLSIQQGILWQSVPAYAFGLYTNFSKNAVLTGTSVGLVTSVVIISVIFSNDGAHNPLPLVDKAWSTLTAVAFNIVFTVFCEYFIDFTIFPKNEGDSSNMLSLRDIRRAMRGIREPVTFWGGIFVWMPLILSFVALFHWAGDIDPDLIEEYGREFAEDLRYNGEVSNIIGGLPDYILFTMLWYVVAMLIGIAAWMQWDVTTADTSVKLGHVATDSVDLDLDDVAGKVMNGVSVMTNEAEMTGLTTNEAVEMKE